MRISRQASLKKFNTFNVTENADVIYEVEDISMLKNIVSDNNQIELPRGIGLETIVVIQQSFKTPSSVYFSTCQLNL